MKTLFLTLLLMTASYGFAQNRNARASLNVDGVCMMCKDRIEKASIKTKGVKSANWNVNTHELKLIYNEKKTSLADIRGNILAVGHDVETFRASDEAYNSVHPCCKYREEEVKNDHKKNQKEDDTQE